MLLHWFKYRNCRNADYKQRNSSISYLEGEDKEDKEDGIEIFYDPVEKPNSIEITNALNTLQNFCPLHEVGNDMLELFQKFELLHVQNAARKQSSILTYFNQI